MAERLIENIEFDKPIDLSPEWRNEIQKRSREIDEGTVELADADIVFSRLYAALD